MEGGVYALGNFDGIHKGHQATLEMTVKTARAANVPACVLTFEPHPRAFFCPDIPPFRLTPQKVKERLLADCGIDKIITFPFNAELAQMSAEDFVRRILIDRLRVRHIVAGCDFVFGQNRRGTMKAMAELLAPHGVGTTEVNELGADSEVYSSTRIRELLLEGEVEAAARILGRPWAIEGTIVNGQKIGGNILGFPTANIGLGDYLRPKFGVYAIQAGRVGEPLTVPGVANIGQRPTVNGKGENLEAYLFGVSQDLYGEDWQFALRHFLRPEMRFSSMDALKEQIGKDIGTAKAFFS